MNIFSVVKFPNNIFEKLIDGEPFVSVTPLSREMNNNNNNMQVIHPNLDEDTDDVIMDPDKMMEKEIMEDKQKMDNKNKGMHTHDNKRKRKEKMNKRTHMNNNRNRQTMKEDDVDNVINDKQTKRKMKGKDIHSGSIDEVNNMNHIVEVIEKNEELENAEFKDQLGNEEEERKTSLEKFEQNIVRRIKLSDRPKAMVEDPKELREEERSSKSLSLNEDSLNEDQIISQNEKLSIEVWFHI